MSTGVFLNFIARARAALWSADMFLPPQISVHSKRDMHLERWVMIEPVGEA